MSHFNIMGLIKIKIDRKNLQQKELVLKVRRIFLQTVISKFRNLAAVIAIPRSTYLDNRETMNNTYEHSRPQN